MNQKNDTVDGSEIRRENQLRLVVYPMIYRVLDIPGGERRISSFPVVSKFGVSKLQVLICRWSMLSTSRGCTRMSQEFRINA